MSTHEEHPANLHAKPPVADNESSETTNSASSKVTALNAVRFERGDDAELADALLQALASQPPQPVGAEGALHLYSHDTGTWKPVAIELQRRVVKRFAGAPLPKGRVRIRLSTARGAVALAMDEVHQMDFFSEAPRGLAFTNGFATVEGDAIKLRPHSPDNRAQWSYPFAFDPYAARAKWTAFLGSVFDPDDDASEKIAFLQEFCGASLFGAAPRFQKAVVMYGQGANGKSVLIEVIVSAMPDGSTTAIPPQTWGSEYRLALLAGKRLNAVSELPERDILQSEAFKAVVAGDLTTARQIRQQPFMFRPMAGHLFAANRLPGTVDHTSAFWRRFVVVTFNRIFTASEQNPTLAKDIIDSETPGVVAWLIEGAKRVLHQGSYAIPPSAEMAKDEWRRGSDQVQMFIDDCAEVVMHQVEEAPLSMALYTAYREWAEQNGYGKMAHNKFGVRLRLLGHEKKHTEHGSRYPSLRLINVPF